MGNQCTISDLENPPREKGEEDSDQEPFSGPVEPEGPPGFPGIEDPESAPAEVDDHKAKEGAERLGEEGLVGPAVQKVGKGPGHIAGRTGIAGPLEKAAGREEGVPVTVRSFKPGRIEIEGSTEKSENEGEDEDGPAPGRPETAGRRRLRFRGGIFIFSHINNIPCPDGTGHGFYFLL